MMSNQPSSYLSPKLEARSLPAKGGHGVYAIAPIKASELLVVWGGDIVEGERLAQMAGNLQHLCIQVEEDLYMIIREDRIGPADYVNHSCSPNAGMSGQVALVAMRPIAPGEEVCFDYAMSDGSEYDEFECKCGAPNCRGRVTGEDWKRPELIRRYRGYFSPYLQRRIDHLLQQERAQRQIITSLLRIPRHTMHHQPEWQAAPGKNTAVESRVERNGSSRRRAFR
jgi:hypothetical protein